MKIHLTSGCRIPRHTSLGNSTSLLISRPFGVSALPRCHRLSDAPVDEPSAAEIFCSPLGSCGTTLFHRMSDQRHHWLFRADIWRFNCSLIPSPKSLYSTSVFLDTIIVLFYLLTNFFYLLTCLFAGVAQWLRRRSLAGGLSLVYG